MGGPLKGVKVMSFARALAGPFASMLLCDLGAEVIKIEEPEQGDFSRNMHPFIEGISSYFLSVNRGQKSLTLNLKDERAKQIVFELAKKSDVLIENFRPGVMARLGLDYEKIRKHNPKIVYASISGFGQKGPYSQKPAFDMIAQGMGGTVSITGNPVGPPVRVGYSIGDMGAALFSAISILAALNERERSGEGQWIDVAMMDCQIALCENACARYLATGEIPRPEGTRHPLNTPFQIFPTQDGYIVVIAHRDEAWRKFCTAAGKEEWIDDERFCTNEARLKNYELFEPAINELMITRNTRDWLDILDEHGVMCAPVNNIEQVIKDPHVQERKMVLDVAHPRVGKMKVVGTPMKFSRTDCRIENACPDLGEHTDDILSSWLNMSKSDIKVLRESKVI